MGKTLIVSLNKQKYKSKVLMEMQQCSKRRKS